MMETVVLATLLPSADQHLILSQPRLYLMPWPDKTTSSFDFKTTVKIKQINNYVLVVCLITELITFPLFFSRHILSNPPDTVPAGVFPLKLKEYFTNWQEVVHFN